MPLDAIIDAESQTQTQTPAKTVTTVTIPGQYRGPDASGNGGYVSGILAGALAGPAEVTLHAPPPLDTPLTLTADGTTAELFLGGQCLGTARPGTVDIDVPKAPSLREAAAASKRFAGFDCHYLPGCFVCGTERAEGDGLRLFTGPCEHGGIVATPWAPNWQYTDDAGYVRPEFLWAALDCPSYFGLNKPGLPALLGRMSAEIIERPLAGQPCIVTGWGLGEDGRKNYAASAIYDISGRLLAKAKTIWIELKNTV